MNKSNIIKVAGASATALTFLSSATYAFATDLNLSAPSAAGNVNADPSIIIRFAVNGLIIVGIVASLIFLLWGGIRWILSGGDKAKVDTARNTIVAAIVGLIIVILAWVIINTVLTVLTGCGLSNFTLPSLSTAPGAVEGTRCK